MRIRSILFLLLLKTGVLFRPRERAAFFFDVVGWIAFFRKPAFFKAFARLGGESDLDIWASSVAFLNL